MKYVVKNPLGKIKFHLERLIQYIQRLQFFMIMYLFIKASGINPWWITLLIPLSIIIHIVDRTYVLPGELEEGIHYNPLWSRFLEEFEQLKQTINIRLKEKP